MPRPFSVTEADKREAERVSKVRRYVGDPSRNLPGDLYALCVEVLGYDALSEEFHGPLLRAWDRLDLRRFRQYEGLEPIDAEPVDKLDLWFRGGIKTWCQRARVIRYYLWNPAVTVTWWHAVEATAIESGEKIAEHMVHNDKLRELFPPGILPGKTAVKFYAAGKFTLKGGRRIGDSPSFRAMGAGGEATGGHSLVGVLDDFVGQNDVFDNQMFKKKQFYESTVRNVVLRTNKMRGWIDCIGTHWSVDDPYTVFRESPDWITTVRACLETDGKPDPQGEPVYLSREQIEKERREQPGAFSMQMMNDPSPAGEKPWVAEGCEHYCTLKEAAGAGWVVALGDPAPRAVGSVGGRDERYRKDGTKNWWANVVVKLRRKGELRQIVWLDAEQSKDWGLSEGMDNLVKLGMKWHAKEGYAESTSTPVYMDEFIRSKRELGWRAHLIGEGRKFNAEDRLKQTYNAMAKCAYLTALADRAKAVEFVICESVPKEMVEVFLRQMRGFMPLPDGRTGIPFDDMANAISFATDPYFAPKYQAVSQEFAWSPFREAERDDEYVEGSRHVRW